MNVNMTPEDVSKTVADARAIVDWNRQWDAAYPKILADVEARRAEKPLPGWSNTAQAHHETFNALKDFPVPCYWQDTQRFVVALALSTEAAGAEQPPSAPPEDEEAMAMLMQVVDAHRRLGRYVDGGPGFVHSVREGMDRREALDEALEQARRFLEGRQWL